MHISFEEWDKLTENTFPPISIGSEQWTLTKSKSNKGWSDRIKSRTGLSHAEFLDVVIRGILKAQKDPDYNNCGDNICLRFLISKFVLVINKSTHNIITVRDASFSKLDNGQCDKIWVGESLPNPELLYIIENTSEETEGYDTTISYKDIDGLEHTIIEYTDKCSCCIDIDL